jgi:hypothetical protein
MVSPPTVHWVAGLFVPGAGSYIAFDDETPARYTPGSTVQAAE